MWFSVSKIRDENVLSEKELKYLKGWTFKIFIPLWMLFRRQWDLLILYNVFPLSSAIILQNFEVHFLTKIILILLTFIIPLWSLYIGMRYGRRLAWNRKKWDSFKKFRNSERVWGIIGISFFILLASGYIIKLKKNDFSEKVKPQFSKETFQL